MCERGLEVDREKERERYYDKRGPKLRGKDRR